MLSQAPWSENVPLDRSALGAGSRPRYCVVVSRLRTVMSAVVVAISLAACGLDAVGSFGSEANTPSGDASSVPIEGGDGDVPPDFTLDAAGDAAGEAGPTPALPSFVPGSLLDPDASALTGVLAIDTSALALDIGAGLTPTLPPGVSFTAVDAGANGVAVLSVGGMTINQAIAVSGKRALAIVSSQELVLDQVIDVSASGGTPGPGGHNPATGPGAGDNGKPQGGGNDNSGAGGAGHGTTGAQGGDTTSAVPGGAGGLAYSVPLVGGSGGGRGDPLNCTNTGGAGGGALMLFSSTSITVATTGGVHAGGGGGGGGCVTNGGATSSSGAGGGSGGFIFLEAPKLDVRGTLAANGGGGGGGASAPTDGERGESGVLGTRQADGGAGGAAERQGGSGGSGAGLPQKALSVTNAGGGGGAVGRIMFHTSGAYAMDGGTISPTAAHDGGL